MAKVLQAIREAEDGLAIERALKWFIILPRALFRQCRRGGKAGKSLVGQRINCLVREDWGVSLLLDRDTGSQEGEEGGSLQGGKREVVRGDREGQEEEECSFSPLQRDHLKGSEDNQKLWNRQTLIS